MNELFLPIEITDAERERVYAELAQYPDANIETSEYHFEDDLSLWLVLPDKDARILIMPSPEPPESQPTPPI